MKSSISVTATISTIVDADAHRGEIVLQHQSGDKVWLGINEDAVVGEGISISADTPILVIDDYRAMHFVTAICDTGESATGSFQGA